MPERELSLGPRCVTATLLGDIECSTPHGEKVWTVKDVGEQMLMVINAYLLILVNSPGLMAN